MGFDDDRPDHRPSGVRADLVAVVVAALLVAAAVVVGTLLLARDVPIHAGAAPLMGRLEPRATPGTALAVLVALGVVLYGPTLAPRLRWPTLLAGSFAASVAWVFALGLVDGWPRMAARMERKGAYLYEIPTAPPLPELLATFTDRIVAGSPDSWTTHVAGHPPGALLFFLALDRAGLGGGAWAAVVCILVGASATVAIAVALRALDGRDVAERALPFLVLAPAAMWIGVSGDAVFLGVSAWGLALLAVACRTGGGRSVAAAVSGGLLLGASLYLSYGLVLIGLVALAVLVASGLVGDAAGRAERWRAAIRVALTGGVAVFAVVAAMTLAGFAWWEGYEKVVIRYYQGWGGERPYSYWVWADLAALAICIGPAAVAGMRRAFGTVTSGLARRSWSGPSGTAIVVVAASIAVAAADLSGLSKAEVERIWLPFALWLVAACGLFSSGHARRWLAVQAATVLVVQHVVLTTA